MLPTGAVVAMTSRPGLATYVPMKAGTAAFAIIGGLAAIAEGKDLAKQYQLMDPAPAIAIEIANSFAASKSATVAAIPVVVTKERPADIIAGASGTNYLVDVSSGGITSVYFSFDWTHYGVLYAANLRIFDVATGAVIVKSRCLIKPVKTLESPTNDEMMADDAKVLKAMIVTAGDACLVQLKTKAKL